MQWCMWKTQCPTMIHTPFNKQAEHNRCNCHSHRCYSGHRAGHDAALCSWSGHKHSRADFLSWRHPNENAEDAHPAPHHLQSHHRSVLNHMCCVLRLLNGNWVSTAPEQKPFIFVDTRLIQDISLLLTGSQAWPVWMLAPVEEWAPEQWCTTCPPQ